MKLCVDCIHFKEIDDFYCTRKVHESVSLITGGKIFKNGKILCLHERYPNDFPPKKFSPNVGEVVVCGEGGWFWTPKVG